MTGGNEKLDRQSPVFERWLDDATRGIGALGVARIREEVTAHFREAYDAALADGAAAEVAERQAVEALGDAGRARRRFRRIHLTGGEERVLRMVLYPPISMHAIPFLSFLFVLAGVLFLGMGFVTESGEIAERVSWMPVLVGVSALMTGAIPFVRFRLAKSVPARAFVVLCVAAWGCLGLFMFGDTLQQMWLAVPRDFRLYTAAFVLGMVYYGVYTYGVPFVYVMLKCTRRLTDEDIVALGKTN